MKKRLLSVILSLALIVSSFVNGVPAQQTYAAAPEASSLTYNTGHRDTDAHALSDEAISYYQDFAYNYTTLKSGETSVEAADLAAALKGLMQGTLENQVTYSDLTKYWVYTDAEDGTPGTIYFYADKSNTEVSATLNREHVWPKSHASFFEKFGGADLHHLRPAIDKLNSDRSSYTMGEIDEETATVCSYNGNVGGYLKNNTFEPLENVKGDVARIFLYVYLCWGQPNLFVNVTADKLPAFDPDDSKNDGQKVIESLETLLKWNYDDPVDTWEMCQNDLIEKVQGNRNVFIDYPEYAWLIFGLEVPEGIVSPSSNNTELGNYEPGDLSDYYETEESQIDESKVISVAAANASATGSIVTTEGEIIYIFGTNDAPSSAIIRDENGDTIQIYFGSAAFKQNVGDVIMVKGSIAEYHGVKQISGIITKSVSAGSGVASIAPEEVTLAELNANIDNYVSKLVTVKNVVLGGKGETADTTVITQTIDGVESSLGLYLPASYPNNVARTDIVDIVGIASKRDDAAQIRVGSSSDYTLVKKGEGHNVDLTTVEGILDAAFELEPGEALKQPVTLTGKITSIDTPYNSQYDNVSVIISVSGKSLLCYRLAKGSELKVGDEITVTGIIKNYNGKIEFDAGSTYVHVGETPTGTPDPTGTPTGTPDPTGTPAPTGTQFEQVTSFDDLENGQYIFVTKYNDNFFAMDKAPAENGGANTRGSVAVEKYEDKLVSDDTSIVWTITKVTAEDGKVTYTLQDEDGKYLSMNATKKKNTPYTANTNIDSPDEYAYFTVKANTAVEGAVFFKSEANTRNISAYVEGDAIKDYRGYVDGGANLQPLFLYKLADNTPVYDIADGDYVIYNPSSKKAMSTETFSNYYRAIADFTPTGADVEEVDAALIWTVKNNEDGTITLLTSNGDKLSIGAKNSSLPLNDVNDTWNVIGNDDGTFYVVNAGRTDLYIEYYQSKSEFSAYGFKEANADIYKLSFVPAKVKTAVDPGPVDPEPVNPPADAAKFELVTSIDNFADGKYILVTDVEGSLIAMDKVPGEGKGENTRGGIEVTGKDGVIASDITSIIWTFTKVTLEDGSVRYTIQDEDNLFLTMSNNKNYPYSAKKNLEEATENSYFTLRANGENGAVLICNPENGRNISAYVNNKVFQDYRGYADNTANLNPLYLYKLVEAEPVPAADIPDGDYVIYNPASGKAMSTETFSNYYRAIADFALTGADVEEVDAALIWTVKNNEDGTITLSTANGDKLSIGAKNSSLPLNDVNDTWNTVKNEDGTFYVINAGRTDLYIEYYQAKSEFSAYGFKEANADIYKLSFVPAKVKTVADPDPVDPNPVDPPAEKAQYELVSSFDDLADGKYIFVAESGEDLYAMDKAPAEGGQANARGLAAVEKVDEKIVTDVTSIVWTLTKVTADDGTVTYTIQDEDGKFLSMSNANNKPFSKDKNKDAADEFAYFVIKGNEKVSGAVIIKNEKNTRCISIYAAQDFRGYTEDNNSLKPLYLYKLAETQTEDPQPVDPEPVDPTPVDPTPVDPQPTEPTPVAPPIIILPPFADDNDNEGGETVNVDTPETPEGTPAETVDVTETETPEGAPEDAEPTVVAKKVVVKADAFAEDSNIASAVLKIMSDDTAIIRKLKAASSEVIIPETIKVGDTEYIVSTIAKGCFKGMADVTEITLGANITTVRPGAFKGIETLAKLTVKSYTEGMFQKKAFKGVDTKNCVIAIEVPMAMKKKARQALAAQVKAELELAGFKGKVKIVRVEK